MTPGVPYDAEIEYLESTGTQWIDTGINTPAPFSISLDFNAIPTVSETDIFGTRYEMTSSPAQSHILGFYNRFIFAYNSPNPRIDSDVYSNTLQHFIVLYVATSNSRTLEINEVSKVDYNTPVYSTDFQILLFCGGRLANDTVQKPSSILLKKAAIYLGDVLVRSFIPVRVGQTGYMYDRVSQTLFGNQGSGNFKLGKDIHWTKTLNTRIKNRYDTEENWLTENPILLSGEPAFTTVSGEQKSKVGDGETPYANLPYINNMGEAMIIRKWRD